MIPQCRSPSSTVFWLNSKLESNNMSSKPSPSISPRRSQVRRRQQPVRHNQFPKLRSHPPLVISLQKLKSRPPAISLVPVRSMSMLGSSRWNSTSPSVPSPMANDSLSPPLTSKTQLSNGGLVKVDSLPISNPETGFLSRAPFVHDSNPSPAPEQPEPSSEHCGKEPCPLSNTATNSMPH
jgi:hypothetical protein